MHPTAYKSLSEISLFDIFHICSNRYFPLEHPYPALAFSLLYYIMSGQQRYDPVREAAAQHAADVQVVLNPSAKSFLIGDA